MAGEAPSGAYAVGTPAKPAGALTMLYSTGPVPACVKLMVAEFELQGAINGLGVVIANEGAVA